MGITTKRINGIDYIYFGYYDKTVHAKRYKACGPATKPESMGKAVKLETAYLERRKTELLAEVGRVEDRLTVMKKKIRIESHDSNRVSRLELLGLNHSRLKEDPPYQLIGGGS